MSETISSPRNPSEAFAAASRYEKHTGKLNILDSKAAAYAAQPWMDVAVDLYGGKNKLMEMKEGESVYDYSEDMQGSLPYLTDYAERRAHQASSGKRDSLLTPIENELFGAYKAETARTQAKAKVDMDALSIEQVELARELADDRARAAHKAGDMPEMRKWQNVARRTREANELYFDETLNESERSALEHKFGINKDGSEIDAKHAGYLLNMLKPDGTELVDAIRDKDQTKYMAQAKNDTKKMNEMAELYELFAEVQAQSPTQPEASKHTPRLEVDDMLKKQYELVAQNVAGYANQVDQEILEYAEFRGAKKQVYDDRRAVEALYAAGEIGEEKRKQRLNELTQLMVAMTEYEGSYDGDSGQYELPTDISELTRRRDLMEFLASTNPKKEQEEVVSSETKQEATTNAQTEYNPDDTILPDNPMEWFKFVKNYYNDPQHRSFTPDNIKVMQDFLVLQTRREVDYMKKAFPGRKIPGNLAFVFRMTAATLKQLHETSHDQMFAWKLVANNLNRPDMTFGEFEAMPLKDIIAATGVDITKYIEDYDEVVSFKPVEPREVPETTSFK